MSTITFESLNPKKYFLTPQEKINLQELAVRIEKVQAAYLASSISAEPFTITSGLRSQHDQYSIYEQKAKAAGIPYDKSKVPMGSKHLIGCAADVGDAGLKITAWLKDNPDVLEQSQLWCEDGNKNWVHFQSRPFASYTSGGTRWFKP